MDATYTCLMLRHRHRVLVIDDDPSLREALETIFRMEGYAVATAREGQQAIERLRGGLEPCVILLDLAMPVKDGWQFRREQMRDANLAHIPVIVCSGMDDADTRVPGLGVDYYLRKPIAFDQVLSLVERYCEVESGRAPAVR